jgi:hypothetical protein
MVEQFSTWMDASDLRVIKTIGHMVGLVDFVDSAFVRCWRNQCWTETSTLHLSAAEICALLQRFTSLIVIEDSSNEAQRADYLITRHWICHVLWSLGARHGYMQDTSLITQMRPDYALTIANDSIKTCETFEMTSLECHGVGLVSIEIMVLLPFHDSRVAGRETLRHRYKCVTDSTIKGTYASRVAFLKRSSRICGGLFATRTGELRLARSITTQQSARSYAHVFRYLSIRICEQISCHIRHLQRW